MPPVCVFEIARAPHLKLIIHGAFDVYRQDDQTLLRPYAIINITCLLSQLLRF
jgi:hypothetical protein